MDIAAQIHAQKTKMHPLFNPDLTPENTLFLDFSGENTAMADPLLSGSDRIGEHIFSTIAAKKALYGYGGYMEDRAVYRRSPLFRDKDGNARSIHLGTDIWAPAGTPVYLPLDGKIHSFQNNNTFGDYGPTIIVEHTPGRQPFYCLYGHLDSMSLSGLREGLLLAAGTTVGRIGHSSENGDWPPHLHFQVITDIKGWKGDYPGVCFPSETDKFSIICPDPAVFFQKLTAGDGK